MKNSWALMLKSHPQPPPPSPHDIINEMKNTSRKQNRGEDKYTSGIKFCLM
jgi:hypothetical protein